MPEVITPAGSQVVSPAPQTPQAGDPVTPVTPAEPQAGDATQSQLTHEQALAELAKVRREAAGYRVRANELETEKQAAERAKLTKEEQLAAQVADKERALTELQRQHQEAQVAYAVERAAAKIGIVDPDAAAKLLDSSQLEYDDSGKPKNAEKLLRELVQAKPYLAGTPAVSPTNPSLNHSQRGDFKESDLADIDFYLKNELAIKKAMREGRVIKG